MTRIFPYFCIALILVLQYQAVAAFCPVVKHKLHRTLSVLSAEAAAPTTPKGTMVELKNPITGQQITLIGTAHLSQTSNDQVKYVIETVKPDAIMIELDPSRLERIGLTQGDLGTNFGTCEDIEPPLLEDDIEAMQNRPWWRGFTEVCVDSVAEFARGALTDMYKDMGKTMGKDGLVGGGEFLAAINAAKSNDESSDNGSSTKIVLGDRSSVVTIKRAVELAIRSGDPLGALGRLASANQEELDKMQDSIRQDMEGNSMDESELNVAMVEALKSDAGFRNRIFSRLEREVPEFTRAFLTERDYIMAEAIRRETDAAHVVAVVGLAHVPEIFHGCYATNRAPDADVKIRHDERQEFWKRNLQAGIESGACKDVFDLLEIEVSRISAGFTVSLPKKYQDWGIHECLHSLVAGLSVSNSICSIESRYNMVTLNAQAQWVTQSNVRDCRPFFDVSLSGQGQVVQISDSVDPANSYFNDNINGNIARDGRTDLSKRKVVQYVPFANNIDAFYDAFRLDGTTILYFYVALGV